MASNLVHNVQAQQKQAFQTESNSASSELAPINNKSPCNKATSSQLPWSPQMITPQRLAELSEMWDGLSIEERSLLTKKTLLPATPKYLSIAKRVHKQQLLESVRRKSLQMRMPDSLLARTARTPTVTYPKDERRKRTDDNERDDERDSEIGADNWRANEEFLALSARNQGVGDEMLLQKLQQITKVSTQSQELNTGVRTGAVVESRERRTQNLVKVVDKRSSRGTELDVAAALLLKSNLMGSAGVPVPSCSTGEEEENVRGSEASVLHAAQELFGVRLDTNKFPTYAEAEKEMGKNEKNKKNPQSIDQRVNKADVIKRPRITREQTRVVRSAFGRASTIFFEYPVILNVDHLPRGPLDIAPTTKVMSQPGKLNFKLYWERNSVKDVFASGGLTRTQDRNWNVHWGKHLHSHKDYSHVLPCQRVNHFPSSGTLGRKDRLAMLMNLGKRRHGSQFDFHPESFVLPRQRDALKRQSKLDSRGLWIRKPVASAQGKGIRVLTSEGVRKISKSRKCIVQKYVDRPHLIDSTKYDVRMYILVTSYEPLRVYMFPEGLVRFCAIPYSRARGDKLRNNFGHLTNTSINKHHDKYVGNEHEMQDDKGSKWSLRALLQHLAKTKGCNPDKVLRSMMDIAVKTVIASDENMTPALRRTMQCRDSCFELFGFDFILDAKFKVWLVEVNVSPSLMASTPLDRVLKTTLVTDTLNTVGIPVKHVHAARRKACKDQRARLHAKKRATSALAVPRVPISGGRASAGSVNSRTSLPSTLLSGKGSMRGISGRVGVGAPKNTSAKQGGGAAGVRTTAGKMRGGVSCARGARSAIRGFGTRAEKAVMESAKWNNLSARDRDLVGKVWDEHRRCGHFMRIFPPPNDNALHDKYLGLFASERYDNSLIRRFEGKIAKLYKVEENAAGPWVGLGGMSLKRGSGDVDEAEEPESDDDSGEDEEDMGASTQRSAVGGDDVDDDQSDRWSRDSSMTM